MPRLHQDQMKRNQFSIDCKCFCDLCVMHTLSTKRHSCVIKVFFKEKNINVFNMSIIMIFKEKNINVLTSASESHKESSSAMRTNTSSRE